MRVVGAGWKRLRRAVLSLGRWAHAGNAGVLPHVDKAPQAHEKDDPDPEFDESQRPLDWGLIGWLYGYTRPHARMRNALAVIVVIRSVQLPLLAWTITAIINGPITTGSTQGLVWSVAGFLTLAVLTQLTFYFRQRWALDLGEAVVRDMRGEVFAHLQTMQMDFFNRTRLGRIISRFSSDAEAVRTGVQDVFFRTLVGLGQMAVAGGLMLWADGLLFAIVASMMGVLWGLNRHFRRRLSQVHRDVQESFSRVTSNVAEAIQGVQVTQSLVQESAKTRDFRDLASYHAENNLRAARTAGVFLPMLELNSQVFLAILLMVGGYRVLSPSHAMPLAELIQFLFLANLFFQPVQILGEQYNQALVAMAGAERIRHLLSQTPDWTDPPLAVRPAQVFGHVRFEDVTFGYDPDSPVLQAVTFEASPGRTVALVGHTGSGKTSVINLLAKYYLPTSGRILLDGRDTRELDSHWLRRQMGVVLQQNLLFTGSVRENIRLGRPEATDDDVKRTLADLGCLDMFESLAEGLDTEVGESGANLSLGQRQLVCFARAMVANPQLIILDEATSSVDPATERRIQAALERLLHGRTAFVIAHRLSTVENADLVLVLDGGRVVERGSHHELLARGGPYAQLERQSRGFAA